jgi:cell wall-associated NlpC family hydrolase
VRIAKATSVVSKPGAAGTPSSMRLARSGAGAPLDVLMCRYRRSSSKAWDRVGTADLVPNGHLAKRMPADVRGLGRAFALSEKEGQSADSVIVLVASSPDGKPAELDVSAASKGLQKRKHSDGVHGKPNTGAKIVKQASDPSWKQYDYGEEIIFPEAKDEVFGYENKSFDCSYYTWLVYNRAGISYDFTGTEGLAQLGGGQFVKVTTPRPGDLVVWRPELGSGDIHHVGIVAEDTSTFWDNSGSSSVGLSKFSWPVYDVPRIYLRRKGL